MRRRLTALEGERQAFTRHAGQMDSEQSRVDREARTETGPLEFARTVAAAGLDSLRD